MIMITVNTQITFRDFLLFHLKTSLVRFMVFPLIVLFFFIADFYNAGLDDHEMYRQMIIWWFIFFIFLVIRSYFSVKKVFFSNQNIQEAIAYTFTDEKIRMAGETFDSDFTWADVYKVKENKDWFLIYQSAQVMNMVPKKYFTHEQIPELRNMIKANHVKARLRKD